MKQLNKLSARSYLTSRKLGAAGVNGLLSAPRRFQSSYVESFARKLRDAEASLDSAILKELYKRNDPEAVIRYFESQPSLHTNQSAVGEYIKTLVKVDKLDESELLKTCRDVSV